MNTREEVREIINSEEKGFGFGMGDILFDKLFPKEVDCIEVYSTSKEDFGFPELTRSLRKNMDCCNNIVGLEFGGLEIFEFKGSRIIEIHDDTPGLHFSIYFVLQS